MEQKVKTKKSVSKKISTKAEIKKTVKKAKPTFEQIQQRAYQIYVENGYKGTDLENWTKAEKELK